MKWYGTVAAGTAFLTGAGISLYMGLSSFRPTLSVERPSVTAPPPVLEQGPIERNQKLSLQGIYEQYKDPIHSASQTYDVPVSLIVGEYGIKLVEEGLKQGIMN